MQIRLALPGNRYLPHTHLLLRRLNASPVRERKGEFTFEMDSCSVTVFITKARDTIALLQQSAVEAAIAPDEWLLEHFALGANSIDILGAVPWLNVRLSVFGAPETKWPPDIPRSVVTPFPNLVRKHCEESSVQIDRIFSVTGTTEVFIPALADFGFDTVESGATLITHKLVELSTMYSDLGLSLASRQATDRAWLKCVDALLNHAYEARILNTT